MQALQNICSRYESQSTFNFVAPSEIWPGLGLCAFSTSAYALVVIGNIHNSVMSSVVYSKWTKIVVVLLLDVASLAVIYVIKTEAMIRAAIGVACLPFAALAFLVGSKDIAKQFCGVLLTAILTFAQMPNALYTVFTLTTSTKNIDPMENGMAIFNFITCGMFKNL